MLLKHCKARPRFFACLFDKAFEFFIPNALLFVEATITP